MAPSQTFFLSTQLSHFPKWIVEVEEEKENERRDLEKLVKSRAETQGWGDPRQGVSSLSPKTFMAATDKVSGVLSCIIHFIFIVLELS